MYLFSSPCTDVCTMYMYVRTSLYVYVRTCRYVYECMYVWRTPSILKAKSHLQLSQTKSVKPTSVKRLDVYVNFFYDIRLLMVRNVLFKHFFRETNVKDTSGTSSLAQENQPIKQQKLDGVVCLGRWLFVVT